MTDNISINTQSSIRIEDGIVLYFDPYQIEEARHDADYVFITHEHYDHFSPEDILKVANDDTILIAPDSMGGLVLETSGMKEQTCRFFAPGTVHECGRMVITTYAAYNRKKPLHKKNYGWVGYAVELENTTYFVSGATEENDENITVRCNVAFVPIGGSVTMDSKEAAKYVAKMRPDVVIPTHYGSIFGEKEDGEHFRKLLNEIDKDIKVVFKLPA